MANLFNNIRLSKKIPIFVLCSAITLGAAIGTLAYKKSKNQLTLEIQNRLSTVNDLREDSLKLYLKSIQEDLVSIASNPNTINALKSMSAAWDKLGANQSKTLQRLYIDENPNPVGKKNMLFDAKDGSEYSQVHAQFHPWFHNFIDAKGFYDVFLINTAGDVVYTYFKELDFATNMQNGQWKDTDIANAFRKAISAKNSGDVFYFNFKPYAPSNNVPAAFIIAPIFENKLIIGAVAFQMPISRINDIMKSGVGLGETGQAYLVDENGYMNTDSRFSEQSTILSQKIETSAVQKALAGQSGLNEEIDYTGETVLEDYQLFEFLGTKWAIISTITSKEAYESIVSLRNAIIWSSLAILAGLAAISIWVSRTITKPISETITSMNELSKGNLNLKLSESDRGDEIGDMIQALHIFKHNALETKKIEKAQEEERNATHKKQLESMQKISKAVEVQSQESGERIGSFANEITKMATNLNLGAKNVLTHSERVNGLSGESMSNTHMISSAAEELSASIREIEKQMTSSKDILAEATTNSSKTENTIENLSQAIGKISEFTTIISEIADKTNLLALNATIEAARAGEAGKGFAVVANEVKDLANQTAVSTEEISKQIKELVSTTQVAVVDVKGINESIQQMNEITSAISLSIEHQSAATQDISSQITQAARSVEDISSSIASVMRDAQDTENQSGVIIQTIQSLESQIAEFSDQIQGIVQGKDKRELESNNKSALSVSCAIEQDKHTIKTTLTDLTMNSVIIENAVDLNKDEKAILHIDGLSTPIELAINNIAANGKASCTFDLDLAQQAIVQEMIDRFDGELKNTARHAA